MAQHNHNMFFEGLFHPKRNLHPEHDEALYEEYRMRMMGWMHKYGGGDHLTPEQARLFLNDVHAFVAEGQGAGDREEFVQSWLAKLMRQDRVSADALVTTKSEFAKMILSAAAKKHETEHAK